MTPPNGKFASSELKMITVNLTPQLARALLDHARANRCLRPSHVKMLADQMTRGQWNEAVPQPIGFDRRGRLADGQHRCTAVVESGCTIEMWCALGLDEDTILRLDGGKQRTIADRFLGFTSDKVVRDLVDGKSGRATHAASITNLIHQALAERKCYSIDRSIGIVRMFHTEMAEAIDTFGSVNHTRRAAVLSAFTLAWFYVNGAGDEEMTDTLRATADGIVSGENLSGTAATLNRYLHDLIARSSQKHADSSWLSFTKTLRALQAILSGEPPQRRLVHTSKPRRLFHWYLGDVDRIMLALKIEKEYEAN